MAFWAKSVDLGAIESFKPPPGYGLVLKHAALSVPDVEKTVTLLVTTTNFDGTVVTVPLAHLSKASPQVSLDIMFADDRVKFAAFADGTEQPDGFVALTGVIDLMMPGLDDEEESDEEQSQVGQLLYALEDGDSDDSQVEVEGDVSSDEDSSDGDSEDDSEDDDSTSTGTSSDDDSEEEEDDALALAYVGDDAQGNPQLITPDGSMFSMMAGEEEDEDGEPQMYLVENGHLDDAAAASSSSDDDDSEDEEEDDMAMTHGPVYVMESPSRSTQAVTGSARRSSKRRRSGMGATPGSAKRAAFL